MPHRPRHERIWRIRTTQDLREHLDAEAAREERRRLGEWGFVVGAGVVAVVAVLLALLG